MKYYMFAICSLVSLQANAGDFTAKCQNFEGVELDGESGRVKPFMLNDGTTYEFSYSSANVGHLRYVVGGTGVIEPKKSERWHDLQLLKRTSSYLTAMNYIGQDYMLFTLYPNLKMLHIAWIEHPNRKYKEGGSFLIRVDCEFFANETT